MLVYLEDKSTFNEYILSNIIEEKILSLVEEKLGHSVGKNEVRSWKNSLGYMDRVLNDDAIPDDAGVAIEYNIPQTSKRIDFIITMQASEMMAPLHHRMPLIFNGPEAWLEGNSFEGHLDDLSWHAVGKTVNNTENQGAELISEQ